MIAVCFSVYAVFPVAAAEEYFHHQKINDVMTSTLQSSTIFAVLLSFLACFNPFYLFYWTV